MKPAAILAAVIAVFALGLFVGWRAGSTGAAKVEAAEADARTGAITNSVNTGLATRQAEMTNEQQATLRLSQTVGAIHLDATNFRLEISNVRFDPPANAGVCPDPVGSDDFVRLYNAAGSPSGVTGDPASAASR